MGLTKRCDSTAANASITSKNTAAPTIHAVRTFRSCCRKALSGTSVTAASGTPSEVAASKS